MNIITRRMYRETGKYVARCGITDKKSITQINELVGGLYSKNLFSLISDVFILGDRWNKQNKLNVESLLNVGGAGSISGSLLSWNEEGIETDPTCYVDFANFTADNNPSSFYMFKPTGSNPAASASAGQLMIACDAIGNRHLILGPSGTGNAASFMANHYSDGASDYRHYSSTYSYSNWINRFGFIMFDASYADTSRRTLWTNPTVSSSSQTAPQPSARGTFSRVRFTSYLSANATGRHTFFILFKNVAKVDQHWTFLKQLFKGTIGQDLPGIVV